MCMHAFEPAFQFLSLMIPSHRKLNSAQNLSQKSTVNNYPANWLWNDKESIAKTRSVLPMLQLPFKREVLCLQLH